MKLVVLGAVLLHSSLVAQWAQLPDFPGSARDDAASFTINGVIYVGTGMEVGWGLTNDWYAFDTQSNTWSAIAPLPATPRQYCTAFALADTGYLFGGVDANGALNELWAYDPVLDEWSPRASLPAEARYACAAAVGWGYGIIATGMLESGVPTKQAWKYHPPGDQWEAMNPVPGPSRHRATAFQDGGGVCIVGGADSMFVALSDAWSYPVWFETGEWYSAPDLPAPRYGARSGPDNTMVAVGGASDASSFHAEAWSAYGGTWEALAPFPGGPRRGGVGAGTESTQFWASSFFFGLGLSGDLERKKDWWKLDLVLPVSELSSGRLSIYPNPSNSQLNISGLPAGPKRLRLVDPQGVVAYESIFSDPATVATEGLPPGMYVVSVLEGNGTVHRARWIKL